VKTSCCHSTVEASTLYVSQPDSTKRAIDENVSTCVLEQINPRKTAAGFKDGLFGLKLIMDISKGSLCVDSIDTGRRTIFFIFLGGSPMRDKPLAKIAEVDVSSTSLTNCSFLTVRK